VADSRSLKHLGSMGQQWRGVPVSVGAPALRASSPTPPRLVSPAELRLAMGRMLSLKAQHLLRRVLQVEQLSRCTRLAPKGAAQDAATAACTDTKPRLARAVSGALVSLSQYLCAGTGAFLSILGTRPASKYPLPKAVSVCADTS